MSTAPRWSMTIGLFLLSALAQAAVADEPALLRPQAVVDLAFDEESGDARDAATRGEARDAGTLRNGATRVASPFWNHAAGRAVLVDGEQKQFVEIAHGPDTSRPRSATVAFFFLNLVPPETAEFVGLFAKRGEQAGNVTNYGVNYGMKGDALQLYVNDGAGYRVARYSVAGTLGHRRRVHVAATVEVARAPAADAENPPSDVRLRLFVNGRIVKPAGGGQGVTIDGNDAWATGIDVSKLANDVPLTLGATNAQREFASGLFDDFLLFDRALSPEEIDRLFLEVVGTNARTLAEQEGKGATRPAAPKITGLAPRGAPLGKTTRVVVTGSDLSPLSFVSLPDSQADIKVVADGSTAEKLLLDVTLPKEAPSGFVPLRVQTEAGLSNAVAFAVDSLPARLAADSSREKPSPLPGAFTGTFGGAERPRIWFRGKKGDRVAAEVEAKRIGAAFDPVLELKNDRDRPLMIAGESIPLRGDARVEMKLPADGLYCVELHDLQFRAPANSPFRLLVGDIALIDAFLPTIVNQSSAVRAVGSGAEELGPFPTNHHVEGVGPNEGTPQGFLVKLPERFHPAGPAPVVLERHVGWGQHREPAIPRNAPVEVPRADDLTRAYGVHGSIGSPGEEDYFILQAQPGEKLSLALETRSIDSPLHGFLTVSSSSDSRKLADSGGQPDAPEPRIDLTVPAGVTHLLVAIRDRYGRGNGALRYRLKVTPGGNRDFSLKVLDAPLSLPVGGRSLVRLEVSRAGYDGPIELWGHDDDPAISFAGAIPADTGTQSVLAVLSGSGGSPRGRLAHLRILGMGAADGSLSRNATVALPREDFAVPGFDDLLPVTVTADAGLRIDVPDGPDVFRKGGTVGIPLEIATVEGTVRLSLLTTEPSRPVDPRDPKKGTKPRIEALAGQVVPPGETEAVLRVTVPADVEVKDIQWAIRAELVPHAWSDDVRATTYSQPFATKIE